MKKKELIFYRSLYNYVFFSSIGIIRSHMQRAIDTGREIIQELQNTTMSSSTSSSSTISPLRSGGNNHNSNTSSSSLSSSSSSSSSSDQAISSRILQRLQKVTRNTIPISSNHHALAIAIHIVLIEYFHAICTGSTNEEQQGPTAGFAAPVREIPADILVPTQWIGNDNASFFTRYTIQSKTILLALLISGPHMIIHARTTTNPKKDTSFEIDVTRFISNATPVVVGNHNDNDITNTNQSLPLLSAWYRLLNTTERSNEFIKLIETHLIEPLIGKANDDNDSMKDDTNLYTNSGLYHDPLRMDRSLRGNGGNLMGIPTPLTGHTPGDFDRDLYPNVQHTIPGNLLGSNNNPYAPSSILPGNLVGPDHPLFTGNPQNFSPFGPTAGRSTIPGIPPGARFDPFGPPGVLPPLPGYQQPPRNNNIHTFGPNPDHLPPPNFNNNNDDRPSDMYM